MKQFKTRKVTEMGRLVTRGQLHNAANQIADAVSNGLRLLEEQQDARFARIEKELGLEPMGRERAVKLVGPEEIPEGGSEARSVVPQVPA